MKFKHVLLSAFCIYSLNEIQAQNEADAIRYSFQSIGSTARSYGIAGAFGSIGADLSCASINPAGMARFRTSQFGLSTSFYNNKNNAQYIGKELSDKAFNFNLPNLGFAFVIPGEDYENKKPEGFVSFTLGFNVNRLNNLHSRTVYNGINSSSSITQNWADRANETGNVPIDFSRYSLEHLAYSTWAIDKDTLSSTPRYISAYGKNAPIKVDQLGSLITKGALNDYNVSFAGNYQHKFLFGLSLGAKSVRYISNSNFKEVDVRNSPVKDIKSVELSEYVKTSGIGLNAKLGLNYSPNEFVRIGYAFHSPTVFNLKDSYNYTMTTVFDNNARDPFDSMRIGQRKATPGAIYKYKITTPARNVFSFALVDKNIGFLSLDLESVNYTTANLSPTKENAADYAFSKENLNIKSLLNSSVINLRLGGEYIYDNYRFRAGYARYPSPYKNNAVPYVKNLVNNMYTLGFGIKTKAYAVDFAFISSKSAGYIVPYQLDPNNPDNGSSYAVTNNFRTTNFVVSAAIPIN